MKIFLIRKSPQTNLLLTFHHPCINNGRNVIDIEYEIIFYEGVNNRYHSNDFEMVVNLWRCLHNASSGKVLQPNWMCAGAVHNKSTLNENYANFHSIESICHWDLPSKALHFIEDLGLFIYDSSPALMALHVNWKTYIAINHTRSSLVKPQTMESINYVIIFSGGFVSNTFMLRAAISKHHRGPVVGHLHNFRTCLKISLSWEFRFFRSLLWSPPAKMLPVARKKAKCGSTLIHVHLQPFKRGAKMCNAAGRCVTYKLSLDRRADAMFVTVCLHNN